jgi:nucleoside-diphosphate-sugar epimerase
MKIGIIGATGMLGHHSAKAVLAAGHELVVIHRRDSKLDKINDLHFESRIGDLDDKNALIDALKDLDAVMNCGAYYPTVPLSLSKEMDKAKAQMDNFIEAGELNKVKKMLYLGGSIALPKSENGIGNEDLVYTDAPENKTPYVQVKWLMDKMAREAGLIVGIPSMTFGEFDWGPSTGTFVVRVANNAMPNYVEGNRNAVYAGDAGRGLLLAVEHGKKGERYLITGRNTNMTEILTIIAHTTSSEPPKNKISLAVAKTVSKVQEAKYYLTGALPEISATSIAIMGSGQHLDGAKAKRELGYEPQVSLEDAIQKAYIWFKSVGYITEGGVSSIKMKI